MHEQRFIFLYRRPIQSFSPSRRTQNKLQSPLRSMLCNPSDLWRQISTKNEQRRGGEEARREERKKEEKSRKTRVYETQLCNAKTEESNTRKKVKEEIRWNGKEEGKASYVCSMLAHDTNPFVGRGKEGSCCEIIEPSTGNPR